MPQEALKALADSRVPIFYLNYLANPAVNPWRDLIGSAQTGTGKTAAFLLPVIHGIISSEHGNRIRALVIVPTR